MMSDNEIENVLPKKLMAFWRSKGCEVEAVWAERMATDGGVALWVGFLPGVACFSQMTREWENAAKWLMYYLVTKGYTKGVGCFCANVLLHCVRDNENKILFQYNCRSDLLRSLEKRRYSLIHPLSRMKVADLGNHNRIRCCILYSKYLNANEYPSWMADDLMLTLFLLDCMRYDVGGAGGDWLKLSEVYLLVRKITSGRGVSGDATVERTIGIIRYLLENELARAGEVAMLQNGEKKESCVFRDSTLTKDKLISVIHEEIRCFSANETCKTTLWLRDTDKSEEFDSAHKGESIRLGEWYHKLITDFEIGFAATDDDLHVDTDHFKLAARPMRYRSKLKSMFSRHRYICSYAVYGSKETKTGWIKTATGMERPFVLRVFIWDEDDMITRPNALCIARVSVCIRLNGNTEVKIEYEKGEGELKVDIIDTPTHETAKSIRLRYKGAETLVRLPADMTEQKENPDSVPWSLIRIVTEGAK